MCQFYVFARLHKKKIPSPVVYKTNLMSKVNLNENILGANKRLANIGRGGNCQYFLSAHTAILRKIGSNDTWGINYNVDDKLI